MSMPLCVCVFFVHKVNPHVLVFFLITSVGLVVRVFNRHGGISCQSIQLVGSFVGH
jgi:hypothetical protein